MPHVKIRKHQISSPTPPAADPQETRGRGGRLKEEIKSGGAYNGTRTVSSDFYALLRLQRTSSGRFFAFLRIQYNIHTRLKKSIPKCVRTRTPHNLSYKAELPHIEVSWEHGDARELSMRKCFDEDRVFRHGLDDQPETQYI